jgi:AraC-like DNA-binding protein
MHPGALDDLVHRVAGAVDGQPDQIELGAGHGGDGGPVVGVVAGLEQLGGEDRHRQPPAHGPLVRLLQHGGVTLEHQRRLAEHGRVGGGVGVGVGLADQLRVGGGDAAGEEDGHVQALPRQQVVAQHQGDLGLEAGRGLVGIHAPIVGRCQGPVLYVLDVIPSAEVRAWRPALPGVSEVFHAYFPQHAYPLHTHEAWTLLIVDSGAVAYALEHHAHGAAGAAVTLLPPHVPHDGRAATAGGFRKRVVYLDASVFDPTLIGPTVDHPTFVDPVLRGGVDQFHRSLAHPGDELEAGSWLALITERLGRHLRGRPQPAGDLSPPELAHRLRDLIDANLIGGVALDSAARLLHADPAHLVRTFTRSFGMPPHRYLTGRRIDTARRLLLDGCPPSEAATAVGFFDQSHLTRHFKRMLGIAPGRYAPQARR